MKTKTKSKVKLLVPNDTSNIFSYEVSVETTNNSHTKYRSAIVRHVTNDTMASTYFYLDNPQDKKRTVTYLNNIITAYQEVLDEINALDAD